MPIFRFHLRRAATEPDDVGIELPDLHGAYLEACRSIPGLAQEELIAGRDPLACAILICDAGGAQLMEVPFAELLSPAEWRLACARRRPHGGVRSAAARDALALAGFRRMFSTLDVGCVLMTPDLAVIEMNAFGARHSHVDPEAIRGRSILDIFDLAGRPRADFTRFMALAAAGASSEIVDMPYLVLDAAGRTVDGWWTARTWPIHDVDGHLLGLVEWAEPSVRPRNGGTTLLRVAAG